MKIETEQQFNRVNAIHQLTRDHVRQNRSDDFVLACKENLIKSGFEEHSVMIASLDNDGDYRGNTIRKVCLVRISQYEYVMMNIAYKRAVYIDDISKVNIIGTM